MPSGIYKRTKSVSKTTRKKMSLAMTGKKFGPISEERRLELSLSHRGPRPWRRGKTSPYKGEKHHWWKGGTTSLSEKIRKSSAYRIWRKEVFERDDYTCVLCRRKGVKLNADHIKPFAYYPKLRLSLSNGRTLCVDCHKLTDTFGKGKFYKIRKLLDSIEKTIKQLREIL